MRAVVIEELDRGDAAALDDPAAAQGRVADVQIKIRVEHVEEAAGGHGFLDLAAVDLRQAFIAQEHHDGNLVLRRVFQQGAQRCWRHALDHAGWRQAQRLFARQMEFAHDLRKLVYVRHVFPGQLEFLDVDLAIGLFRRFRRHGQHVQFRALLGHAEVCHQLVVDGHARLVAQVDFVHGRAVGIKKLQAARGLAVAARLLHGKCIFPVFKVETQVDLAAQVAAGDIALARFRFRVLLGIGLLGLVARLLELAGDARRFDDAVFIARDRLHQAQVQRGAHDFARLIAIGLQARDALADVGCQQLRFRRTQRARRVADLQLGLLGAQGGPAFRQGGWGRGCVCNQQAA